MSQADTQTSGDIGICLIGCERVGKTTLLKVWNNEGFEPVYSKTDSMYFKNVDVQAIGSTRNVKIFDCSGSDFKNSRGTVDSYIANGPIHIFVVSKDDKGSVTFLKGFINSVFYRKSSPKYKCLVVTKCNEEDGTEGILEGIIETTHLKRYDVNCEEEEKAKTVLESIVTDYLGTINTSPKKKNKSCGCVLV